MDGQRFDVFAKNFMAVGSRRRALSWLLAGVIATSEALSSGINQAGAKKKKKKHKDKKKKKPNFGALRVEYCLTYVMPQWCPYAVGSSFQSQCVSEITDCCYQARVSVGAFCACASALGWGHCTG